MTFVPLPVGTAQVQLLDGYFTKALYFRSQPAHEVERRLGYRAGRLREGWWLMFLTVMPTVDQFEYRGMTHLPDGMEAGLPPGSPNVEDRLRKAGFNLTGSAYQKQGMKQKTIIEVFRLKGPDRLAKIRPAAEKHGDPTIPDFPPGSGFPQWTLTQRLPWVAGAFVAPGQMYLGNYAQGT